MKLATLLAQVVLGARPQRPCCSETKVTMSGILCQRWDSGKLALFFKITQKNRLAQSAVIPTRASRSQSLCGYPECNRVRVKCLLLVFFLFSLTWQTKTCKHAFWQPVCYTMSMSRTWDTCFCQECTRQQSPPVSQALTGINQCGTQTHSFTTPLDYSEYKQGTCVTHCDQCQPFRQRQGFNLPVNNGYNHRGSMGSYYDYYGDYRPRYRRQSSNVRPYIVNGNQAGIQR